MAVRRCVLLHLAFVVLLSTVVASSAVIEAGGPPFPCLLNHGCVCNHSLITRNIYDGQFYATCVACQQQGWTGPFCDEMDVPCMNGGHSLNASDPNAKCQCPESWGGSRCEVVMCPHSVDGAGADHIAVPNASTQSCDACENGWSGVTCGVCHSDSACAATAVGGAAPLCDTSLIARGSRKHFECRVANPMFLKLLGHNVEGRVTMDCVSNQPAVSFASVGGTCSVAFFRIEENASYMDPFFFCTAQNCSLVVDVQKDDDSHQGSRDELFQRCLALGQAALLGLCLLVSIVGQFSTTMSRHVLKRLIACTVVALAVTLVVFVLGVAFYLDVKDSNIRSVVRYQCDAAHCVCAPNPPPQYTPVCSSSAFGEHVLPIIKHGMDLVCHPEHNTCVFTPRDVPTSVALECSATECVNADVFPDDPAIAAVVGNGATSSGAQRDRMWIAGALAGSIILLFTGWHLLYSSRLSARNTSEFEQLFFRRSSARSPTRRLSLVESELGTIADDDDAPDAEVDSPGNDEESDSPSSLSDASIDNAEPRALLSAYQSIPTHDNDDNQADDVDMARLGSVEDDAFVTSPVTNWLAPHHRRAVRATMSAPITLHVRHVSYSIAKPHNVAVDVARRVLPAALGECLFGSVSDSGDSEEGPDDTHRILRDVSFSVQSGELVALMGPSGAGKTTLLDLLAMRAKGGKVEGHLSVNGVVVTSNAARSAQYRAMVGYVSQEDTLLPSLTVRETIAYAARLKLPTAFSDGTIDQIVDAVLASLRLERCAQTVVGDGHTIRGVSGGERRRVSIAVEFVANPRILFLDEPTSGLDAVSARHVMEAVAKLAKDTHLRDYAPHYFAFEPIIVFSIHQPSVEIYELFDKVLLLSRGVSAYFGPASEAVTVLSGHISSDSAAASAHVVNPAERLMQMEDMLTDALRDTLCESEYATAMQLAALQQQQRVQRPSEEHAMKVAKRILHLAVASRRFYPNIWQQLRLLTSRSIASLLGAFRLVVCHAMVTFCVGTLMCVLYHEEPLDLPGALNRAGSVTFLLLVVAFVSLSALDQLISERKLFANERDNGYYLTFPFLCCKVLVDIVPLRVIPVALLSAIIYFPMGLRTDDSVHFVWFLAIMSLFSICMTLVTFAIGIVVGTFGASALITAVVILWNFVFGGLMVQADTIPSMLLPFRHMSPFFVAFEALLVNELDGQMCSFAPTDATGRPSTSAIPLFCVQYLENLGLHPSRFAGDVAVLCIMIVVLFVAVWVLLSTVRAVR